MKTRALPFDIPIFGVAKTVADFFPYRQTVGVSVALEGAGHNHLPHNAQTPLISIAEDLV